MVTMTQIVTREEVDALPAVAPLLAAWRAARAERDRIVLDGRTSEKRRSASEQASNLAAEDYNVAFIRERDRLHAERSPKA